MPYINPYELPTQYKEHKELGRLIRKQRFNVTEYDNATNLDFRITYIKMSDYYRDIEVNVKVSGTLYQWGYWGRQTNSGGRRITGMVNPRSRNSDIRSAIQKEIRDFFKLFGVEKYRVNIKKVTVAESI
jgi:hypothetical protein